MRTIFLWLLWWGATHPSLALDFDRYHSQAEIFSYMESLEERYPDLVTMVQLGVSRQSRRIDYVVVARGDDPSSLPGIYLNGTHHGDEKSSTETTLRILDYVVTHTDDPFIERLLDRYALYFQPLVNPDGHARNTRTDSLGRDPNRDYSYPERPDRDSFEVEEIDLVRQLVDEVRFRGAIAFHSGMEGVLWPWCFTSEKSPDHDVFYTLAARSAQAMSMTLYRQSYFDYPTRGEFIDYAYMKHGTMALTFEVSRDRAPSRHRLQDVVERGMQGALAFMSGLLDLDANRLEIQQPGIQRPFAFREWLTQR